MFILSVQYQHVSADKATSANTVLYCTIVQHPMNLNDPLVTVDSDWVYARQFAGASIMGNHPDWAWKCPHYYALFMDVTCSVIGLNIFYLEAELCLSVTGDRRNVV